MRRWIANMRRWRKLRPFATRGHCHHAACLCKHTSNFELLIVGLLDLPEPSKYVRRRSPVVHIVLLFQVRRSWSIKTIVPVHSATSPFKIWFSACSFCTCLKAHPYSSFSLVTDRRTKSLWRCEFAEPVSPVWLSMLFVCPSFNPSFRPTSSPIYLYCLPS